MNQHGKPPFEPPDLSHFDENRAKFPLDQLTPYEGKFVAWDPVAMRIVAAAETREALDEQLDALGVHFSQVVHDYIDVV
jgi:hypothetical protein